MWFFQRCFLPLIQDILVLLELPHNPPHLWPVCNHFLQSLSDAAECCMRDPHLPGLKIGKYHICVRGVFQSEGMLLSIHGVFEHGRLHVPLLLQPILMSCARNMKDPGPDRGLLLQLWQLYSYERRHQVFYLYFSQ